MAKKRISERVYSSTLGMNPVAFQKYIEKLIKTYESDKSTNVTMIARAERNKGIDIGDDYLRRMFVNHNVEIRPYRPPKGWRPRKPSQRYKKLTQTLRNQDVEYLQELAQGIGNYRLVKEYVHLALCVLRGEPCPHALTFIGASMPILFLYDFRLRRYEIISPDLSVTDEEQMSELLGRVNAGQSPNPIHAFCAHKGLFLYGATINPWETKWN